MARTIHRLETIFMLIFMPTTFFLHDRLLGKIISDYFEHVLLIIVPMAGLLPELILVDQRGYHFLEAILGLLVFHEIDKLIKYPGTMRQEKDQTWCKTVCGV